MESICSKSAIYPQDRFDIVVAKETDENGNEKRIVKRVIGLPGDTIKYENDQLYINGKKTDEPYLKEYISKFKKDQIAVDLFLPEDVPANCWTSQLFHSGFSR